MEDLHAPVLMSDTPNPSVSDPLEVLLDRYVDSFVASNQAARTLAGGLRVLGIGLRPVIDSLAFRAMSIEARSCEFISLGYAPLEGSVDVSFDLSRATTFQKKGYPSVIIEEPRNDGSTSESNVMNWVQVFGDKPVHHITVQVEKLEQAVYFLEKQGIPFEENISGKRGSDVREVCAKPEMKDGKPYSFLKLIERHRGSSGFLSP